MYWVKKQHHDFRNDPHGELGLISVIIPVYGKKLAPITETLSSLKDQRAVRMEIIIVSNGVDENSFDAIGITASENFRIVYLGKNMGAAFARNAGARAAKGAILWFIDSDVCGLNPDAASLALQKLTEDDNIGSLGGVIFRAEGSGSFVVGRIREDFNGSSTNSGRQLDDDFVNTACVFLRRSVFNSINGFADYIEYPFDDVDFGFKIRSAGFRCVGLLECAGVHPLYPPASNLFYNFMAMHNLLLHLCISYNPSTFKLLLQKKRSMKWRIAPPSKTESTAGQIGPLLNRLLGLCLAMGWLLLHFASIFDLRTERQRHIHAFGRVRIFE